MPSYRLVRNSTQDMYDRCRAKIQIFGGGFGNGKTVGSTVTKILKFAKDYPGSNGLVARATYPKLNDTIRKEVLKWIPPKWIKRKPTKDDNTLELTNGSIINFRYISQRGKQNEDGSTTSNLLSATYDWIVVDQIEDPEIEYKDFLDLLGRLRGDARYAGEDETMPETGPRIFAITCNPTRNWFYQKIVKPIIDSMKPVPLVDGGTMYCELDPDRTPSENLLVDDETGQPIVALFEGPTSINAHNLKPDFIKTLKATYRGAMLDRFFYGKWAAYEGLVYPTFDDRVHVLRYDDAVEYYWSLIKAGYLIELRESYDYGIAAPSCYHIGFTDPHGTVIILDGYYKSEFLIADQAEEIHRIRKQYGWNKLKHRAFYADPQIFKRTAGSKKIVGKSVAGEFHDLGIFMRRGNNAISSGIMRNLAYLAVDDKRPHPITGATGSPAFFITDRCDWFIDEIGDYYWKKETTGEIIDVPIDKKDHAMDSWKYFMTDKPKEPILITRPQKHMPPFMQWFEQDVEEHIKGHRYGKAA